MMLYKFSKISGDNTILPMDLFFNKTNKAYFFYKKKKYHFEDSVILTSTVNAQISFLISP